MTTIADDGTAHSVHSADGVSTTSVQYVACHSTKGRREENQDVAVVQTILLQAEPLVHLAAIADGMGGHDAGGFAAAEAVRAWFAFNFHLLVSNVPTLIADAVTRGYKFANRRLLAQMAGEFEQVQFGTTLVTVVVKYAKVHVGNVGDSRCSLWRQGELIPLTRDDSFVQPLVDSGFLTPEEAENHPRANELVRALGWSDALDDFAVTKHRLEPGDVILLCSDGLWKGGRASIERRLGELLDVRPSQSALDGCAAALVEDAIERGSDDNISVILLQADSTERQSNEQPDVKSKPEDE